MVVILVESDKEKRAFLFELTSEAQSLMYNGKKEEALQCYDKILNIFFLFIIYATLLILLNYSCHILTSELADPDVGLRVTIDVVDDKLRFYALDENDGNIRMYKLSPGFT